MHANKQYPELWKGADIRYTEEWGVVGDKPIRTSEALVLFNGELRGRVHAAKAGTPGYIITGIEDGRTTKTVEKGNVEIIQRPQP